MSLGGNPLTVKVTLEGTVEDKATELVMTINVPGVGDVKAEFTGAIEYVPSDLAELLSIEFADNAKVAVQPATTDGKNYTFAMTADATADDLKGLVPTIVVSEMATVVPASNKTVDFSQGAVDFVVTAEDGTTTATYTVSCVGRRTSYFDFQKWEGDSNVVPSTSEGWCTSNLASMFLPLYGVKVDNPAVSPVEGLMGKPDTASMIYSINSRILNNKSAESIVPALTAGTMYLGTFQLVIANTLQSTHFGIPYAYKPLTVSGYFKYTPGDSVITNTRKVVKDGPKDEGVVGAVLFEITKDDDHLDGTNAYTDPSIVAKGQFICQEQADFTPFEVKLEYLKDYDPTKKYKFAIICSSSKNGDTYQSADEVVVGSGGSKLIVDDISVVSAF